MRHHHTSYQHSLTLKNRTNALVLLEFEAVVPKTGVTVVPNMLLIVSYIESDPHENLKSIGIIAFQPQISGSRPITALVFLNHL